MSAGVKISIIFLLILGIAGLGFFVLKNRVQNQAGYSQIYNPSQMSQNSTSPTTNSSDAQLGQDLNSINTKLDAVNTEQTGIDAGLNQTAPSLQ